MDSSGRDACRCRHHSQPENARLYPRMISEATERRCFASPVIVTGKAHEAKRLRTTDSICQLESRRASSLPATLGSAPSSQVPRMFGGLLLIGRATVNIQTLTDHTVRRGYARTFNDPETSRPVCRGCRQSAGGGSAGLAIPRIIAAALRATAHQPPGYRSHHKPGASIGLFLCQEY